MNQYAQEDSDSAKLMFKGGEAPPAFPALCCTIHVPKPYPRKGTSDAHTTQRSDWALQYKARLRSTSHSFMSFTIPWTRFTISGFFSFALIAPKMPPSTWHARLREVQEDS